MTPYRLQATIRRCAAVFLFACVAGSVAAAERSPDGLWQRVAETDIPRAPSTRQILPIQYLTVSLARSQLQARLAQAPLEREVPVARSATVLTLPLPDGRYGSFRIVESPIMEAALGERYPQIRTYLGQGIDDPTATLRFDLTPAGFHAQIIGMDGTQYVDPYQPGDDSHYIAYRKRDLETGKQMRCEVDGADLSTSGLSAHLKNLVPKVSSGATLRTYRLAMAATGEYTAFHGGRVIDALAAIVTTMNRVDGIYEREVSVRMVLVANNDAILYTNALTDPYANTSGDLTANQTTINNVIGSANYDIGHLVGTGGGGVAGLGVVCTTSKARGLTGSSAPIGDGFDVDYVAHEMGHQFSGNHTFNGGGTPATAGNNCSGGNRSASTAYEPGSGVSIQAYAGICAADDLQPNSEDHFHRVSLNEILAFTTTGSGNGCAVQTATGNVVPTVSVTAPAAAVTIPRQTPFALTAAGVPGDGDTLTYLWEQFDLGAANAEGVLTDAGTGPLFRSFVPTTNPTRIFPSLRYILGNANLVPQTAPVEGTAGPNWFAGELLPTTTRTLNFRVTVRDNRAGGGGTNEAPVAVSVTSAAGPFAITAPETAISVAAGAATTVTWNVASTTAAPVSTANVRVTLSLDGGHTWPIELAASTPNDGSELLTIPANTPATSQARIRIEAIGNIYFDISGVDFVVNGANTAPQIALAETVSTRQGSPSANAVVATVFDQQDAAGSLGVAISGAPPELSVFVVNNGGNVSLIATAACTLGAPTSGNKAYPLLLTVTDNAGATNSAEIKVLVGSNLVPELGAYANTNMPFSDTRVVTPTLSVADGNDNLLLPLTVSPSSLPGGGSIAVADDGAVTISTAAGTTAGSYTVRVQADDGCGARALQQFTLTVGAPQVTLAVVATQVPTGNGLIEPNECNQLGVTLRNNGNVPATAVSGVLSTATANAGITQANTAFADIPPGESRTTLTPFEISTTGALQCFSTIDATLTVNYTGGTLVAPLPLPVGLTAAQNYTFTASSGASLPNDGVLVAGSDASDASSEPIVAVTTPFAFSVYGTNYPAGTVLRASTNGNLQFRATQGAQDFNNAALPAAGTGNGQAVFPASAPTLFLQWDDWRMDVAGGGAATGAGIYTKVEGSAPNRDWIIEWRGRIRGDGAIATNNRAAIVLHEGSSSFDYIYLLTGAGPSSNGAGSSIGVQAAATGTIVTQYALNNANLAPGTRLTAALAPAVCAVGNGACNAPPGVTLSESGGSTQVVEGGATDSYSVVLNAPPSGNVSIALSPDAQVTVSPNPLSFTTGNWSQAQTVTVTAVDDLVDEGAHVGNIAHAASGGGYGAVVVPGVVANITDNDAPVDDIFQNGFE